MEHLPAMGQILKNIILSHTELDLALKMSSGQV